jgi:energy-coupling factor transporter ATP-binding protein EcfA2
MAETPVHTHITRIFIEGLFGQYSYDLAPKAGSDALSQVFILYGENGSGKTTILWLLNHLLSKELGESHRTFLAKTQFLRFSVYLSNGTVLSATRPHSSVGSFTMTMEQGTTKIVYDYVVDKEGVISSEIVNADTTHEEFRLKLPDLQLTFLADDRKVTTPTVSRRFASARHYFLTSRYQVDPFSVGEEEEEDPSALLPALRALHEWARSRALEGSDAGQRDVNSIYIDLIKQLSKTTEDEEPLSELLDKLSAQGKRSELFSRFALSSEIDVSSIIKAISNSAQPRQRVMTQVIKPYLDSNEARFAALESLQRTLATFVDELNIRFFKNKEISFDLRRGVKVFADGQNLDPKVLSSGEKQLLVLFCNVAQASNRQSLFIIDEPELSLNVGWQRHLIDALQKLASGNVQFIFATHSLELLARHRGNVAKLENMGVAHAARVATTAGAEE